jgi:integrase
MARTVLTDMAIRTMPPPAMGQSELWDHRVPGFGIRVTATGTKSFILIYRFDGRPRRLTLGRYPTLSLTDARKLASQALREVALGVDPSDAELGDRVAAAPRRRMVGATVDEYVEKYAKPKNKDWRTTRDILQREFVAVWGERTLNSISRDDVTRVVDDIVARTSAATGHNRFVYARHFFNWCVGRGYLDVSPMVRLNPPPKAKDRDRVLTDYELGRIILAARKMEYPYGAIIMLLILTAQRKSEVAGMRWSELNIAAGEWSLAADRTKSARKHVVPLPKAAREILKSLQGIHETLVFPARGSETVVSGFSKWKVRLDELSVVENWRVHDLRRTAATGMARLGVAPHVIERILNHTRGTFAGVAGIYNRFGYLPEMQEALERWSKHVEEIATSGATSNEIDTVATRRDTA